MSIGAQKVMRVPSPGLGREILAQFPQTLEVDQIPEDQEALLTNYPLDRVKDPLPEDQGVLSTHYLLDQEDDLQLGTQTLFKFYHQMLGKDLEGFNSQYFRFLTLMRRG